MRAGRAVFGAVGGARHQVAQRLQGAGGAALTAGQVVQPEQGLVGVAGGDDVGADPYEDLREFSSEACPWRTTGRSPREALARVRIIRPQASAWTAASSRALLVPLELQSSARTPDRSRAGAQILTGETCYRPSRTQAGDVRAVQPRARGPGAQVRAKVRHVVPEVGADGGVVVQFREPHVTACPASAEISSSVGEIFALEQGARPAAD